MGKRTPGGFCRKIDIFVFNRPKLNQMVLNCRKSFQEVEHFLGCKDKKKGCK